MKKAKDKSSRKKGEVLVGVIKSKSDLRILLLEKWYRIPVSFLPKRKFTHVAFYQPAALGRRGKRIEYYARVAGREVRKRVELLPHDSEHPRANEDYLKVSFKNIEKLAKPVRNVIPRRVSFGFTDLKTLRSARDILQLYSVPPTEQILEQSLNRLGIKTFPQYTLSTKCQKSLRSLDDEILRLASRTYRLDLAVVCKNGNIAIECDNRKAHSSAVQKLKDKQKDADLKKLGWRVIRFTEADILEYPDVSVGRVQKVFQSLGGQLDVEQASTLVH